MATGGFEHHPTDQIVQEEVQPDFARERRRRATTQAVHLEGDFEVTQGQFHLPATQVEYRQGVCGVGVAVEQGGDQEDLAGAEAPDVGPAAN